MDYMITKFYSKVNFNQLDTLECRRLKADLILYYKIMDNLTPWPIDRYFNMPVHSCQTRLTECISDLYISVPFSRTVNDFSSLFHVGIICHHLLPMPSL